MFSHNDKLLDYPRKKIYHFVTIFCQRSSITDALCIICINVIQIIVEQKLREGNTNNIYWKSAIPPSNIQRRYMSEILKDGEIQFKTLKSTS